MSVLPARGRVGQTGWHSVQLIWYWNMRNTFAAVALVVAALAAGSVPASCCSAGTIRSENTRLPMARTWVAHKGDVAAARPARTPDGVPDLQGTWGGPGGAEAMTSKSTGKWMSPRRPRKAVSDPPDGKIPYNAWALARRNENRAGLSRGWPGRAASASTPTPRRIATMIGPRARSGKSSSRRVA